MCVLKVSILQLLSYAALQNLSPALGDWNGWIICSDEIATNHAGNYSHIYML